MDRDLAMDLCKVNRQCLPLDRISNLPLRIIHTILTLMPIQEAFRTSILSRKWRYHCINIPKLEFDEKLFEGSTDSESNSNKCKIFNVVYSILLLHNDPVLEFSLSFSRLDSSHDIDRIILYLSRNDTLEKFTLCMGRDNEYKLPSSFFSLQKLTHLKLQNCEIQPLSTIAVFSTLTSLWFDKVRVPMSMLLKYLRCFPLLRSFTLINPSESWYPNFFDLLRCLPLIENLHMDYCFAQRDRPFPFGVSLERGLPNMLVHLRALQVDKLSLSLEDEIRSVLVLLTNSPNIEKINLKLFLTARTRKPISQTSINFFDLHDYSYVTLDNLRELKITNFSSEKPGMDFVKFILSKSPMLKRIRIVINNRMSVSDEVKILKNLLWIPSSSIGAQIKFERP